jgi:penicillin V acylase-like amidase (Ntn superfamily)
MRYLLFASVLIFTRCDYGSFDKDKRQIMAKDYVEWHLPPHATEFDITAFHEDTVSDGIDSNFKHSLAYNLSYHFTDSSHQVQQKRTTVLFTPDGHSIITAINQP